MNRHIILATILLLMLVFLSCVNKQTSNNANLKENRSKLSKLDCYFIDSVLSHHKSNKIDLFLFQNNTDSLSIRLIGYGYNQRLETPIPYAKHSILIKDDRFMLEGNVYSIAEMYEVIDSLYENRMLMDNPIFRFNLKGNSLISEDLSIEIKKVYMNINCIIEFSCSNHREVKPD